MCPECYGEWERTIISPFDKITDIQIIKCEKCNGSGRESKPEEQYEACKVCRGTGKASRIEQGNKGKVE